VSSASNSQAFTTTGASQGATSIPVSSVTPNYAYPTSSTVSASIGVSIIAPASTLVPIRVPAGSTLIPTYTSTPTWVVEGE
jgi:hypothetical protein